MANHLNCHDRKIVFNMDAARELAHIIQQSINQHLSGKISAAPDQRIQAATVFLVRAIAGFRQTVGVKQQPVALIQGEVHSLILFLTEHSHRQSGGGDGRHGFVVKKQRRAVTGVANFDLTVN